MRLVSKELAVYSIRQNMIGAEVVDKTCKVLLVTGKTLNIVCPEEENAKEIKEQLLYSYQYSHPVYSTYNTKFSFTLFIY